MRLGRRAALGGVTAAGAGRLARAQSWPDRPIAWIVPTAPGSPLDAFGRPVGQHVSEKLGQPVVIDNRSGAGGTIGIAMAARAPADGHTMVIGATSITYLQTLYPAAGFDFAHDLAPVSALARIQIVLVVNPAVLDVSTLDQLIAAARAKPDAIDFGSPGIGTLPHLAIELLQTRTGIRLHHVPYRNGAQMLQDVLAGQIAAMWATPAEAVAHAKGGKLRAIAIPGRRREPILPDVPTFDEAGLKDFRAAAWFALFAPRRTPEAILDRMHGTVQEALARDDIKALWAEQGAKVELESRADFSRFVDREIVRWNRIARAANIQLE
ncbi:MAG: tripartite tricarboxylate transporter substrate binding protein [Reyranella sp.]|uniref:Bug family tripartite tricarboxylate transporter substrate binding protein n=1 Tax=Reyranella sp. TaxID=1929291 RepID=UPI001ACECF46|nr:tripartite tricarboxylate transporter substrate-binding protein [Reyranella sp.]MBN9090358.1 tripartite tricarboxylate transporter substrate binding protein [Reyranella sp.]